MILNNDSLRGAIPAVPKSFEDAVAKTLRKLPEHPEMERGPLTVPKRKKRTVALAILVAALLLAGSALAAGLILEMNGSHVSFFDHAASTELTAKQDYYERQSDAVDGVFLSAEEGGVSFLINNIAVNDKTVTVFYTAARPEPLPEIPGELEALIPETIAQVDGNAALKAAGLNGGIQRIDASTVTFMEDYFFEEELPAEFTLRISSGSIFGVPVTRNLSYQVDLNDQLSDTRFALCGQTIHIAGTQDESIPGEYWPHDVTIANVRIGRNGGTALLTEPLLALAQEEGQKTRAWYEARTDAMNKAFGGAASPSPEEQDAFIKNYSREHPEPAQTLGYSVPDYCAFVDFAILNDRGESLNVRCDGISTGAPVSENELAFQTDYDTKSLTFLPILGGKGVSEKMLRFDSIGTPVEFYPGFTVTLTEVILEPEQNKLTLRYREDGIRSIWGYGVSRFFGADGRELEDLGRASSADYPFRDDVTGVITNAVTFMDGYDLTKISGVLFTYDIPNVARDQAVTVYFP